MITNQNMVDPYFIKIIAKEDDKNKVKLGDIVQYDYKHDTGIAKLIEIDGNLCIRVQKTSDKFGVNDEILKLKDLTNVYLLDSNQIKINLHNVKVAPPYQFMYDFITRNGQIEQMDNLDKFYLKLMTKDKFRVLDIDKSIMDLIINTDNTAFFRNIFLPSFLINNTFEFGNSYIKGILVYQSKWTDDSVSIEDNIIPDDIRMYFVRFDMDNFITSDFDLSLRRIEKKDIGTKIRIFFQEEKDKIKEIIDRVLLIVCNVIDLIEGNKEDLEFRDIKSNQQQNEKRIKKGKVPVAGRIIIKPKRELLNYINKFEKDYKKFHYSHKFVVRGHWRHLKADRYKNSISKKTWIKPYIKGEGVLIQKPYTLIDKRDDI